MLGYILSRRRNPALYGNFFGREPLRQMLSDLLVNAHRVGLKEELRTAEKVVIPAQQKLACLVVFHCKRLKGKIGKPYGHFQRACILVQYGVYSLVALVVFKGGRVFQSKVLVPYGKPAGDYGRFHCSKTILYVVELYKEGEGQAVFFHRVYRHTAVPPTEVVGLGYALVFYKIFRQRHIQPRIEGNCAQTVVFFAEGVLYARSVHIHHRAAYRCVGVLLFKHTQKGICALQCAKIEVDVVVHQQKVSKASVGANLAYSARKAAAPAQVAVLYHGIKISVCKFERFGVVYNKKMQPLCKFWFKFHCGRHSLKVCGNVLFTLVSANHYAYFNISFGLFFRTPRTAVNFAAAVCRHRKKYISAAQYARNIKGD